MLGKLRHGLGQQIAAGAAGHIVENDGQGAFVCHGGEMGDKTVLGGLIVVGSDHQNGVRPHLTGVAGVVQNVLGVVGAGAGNDGNPSGRLLYGVGDDLFLILRLNGGVLAGGAHDHQAVDAGADLEFHKAAQSLIVDGTVGVHGGDDGSGHTGKNRVFHSVSPSVIGCIG